MQIAATWPVGPRLDELVHRAKSFQRSVRKDGSQALSYIPGKGNSSLPVSTPELNPNLVRIYLDAQHDYLEGRVYMLGALVVACNNGEPVGRKTVVKLMDGLPDTVAKERQLFVDWTRVLLKTVIELAVSDVPGDKKSAPIHVIFFNQYEQRLMLEGLARNFPTILTATPPLYDFLTQIAAYDSPIASYLDEEIRTFKNFPMTCQSLQAVATYLKFDWSSPHDYRELSNSIYGNPNTSKTAFVLPDLAHYEDKAHDMAHALEEFVLIERMITLNDWKTTRHAPPERRVLMGESLLVRYCETDQTPEIVEQNRENRRRYDKRKDYEAAFKVANPDGQFKMGKEQAAECRWSPEGMRLRLRIEVDGVDCDLHQALLMSNLRDGERLVLFSRWTVDERLPAEKRKEFTPTPKQMLYGQRAELVCLLVPSSRRWPLQRLA
jgi:hypothetical protein